MKRTHTGSAYLAKPVTKEEPMSTSTIRLGPVGLVTPDLDRLRAFYEHALGLETVALEVAPNPHVERLAVLAGADDVALVVFETADAGHRADPGFGHRGPIDHCAFRTDEQGFETIRARLVEVAASDGVVSCLGPVLSLLFTDPDGRASNLQRPNPDWDPSHIEMPGRDLRELLAT